ncbi:D-inositol-3-phosphate glycosyltransferase, partial [Mycobacteriaceae bacterium 1482268.1]
MRLATDLPRRVAVLSVHTSPLAQPGTGDAGGMNVYVLQSALQMARRGVEVEIFTRATSSADQPTVRVAPGVLVRNVVAGPFEGLDKYDLPTQLCAFTASVLRAEATHEPGYYDIVHSHYWLSGQVGWLARDRWAVPLVHTAHTLAAVKNAALADGDAPEPPLRAVGEQQVVDEADRLIVNTEHEAQQLVSLHHADPSRIDVVHPGVDLETFTPGDKRAARAALGIGGSEQVVAFVGRIQPLKAPDVLLRAAAKLPDLRVLVAGGPSGSGLAAPDGLVRLADELGIADRVTFLPPQTRDQLVNLFRAADLVAVPSYSESFGLVAVEAQACGTPVVAAAVGGLPVAVR